MSPSGNTLVSLPAGAVLDGAGVSLLGPADVVEVLEVLGVFGVVTDASEEALVDSPVSPDASSLLLWQAAATIAITPMAAIVQITRCRFTPVTL